MSNNTIPTSWIKRGSVYFHPDDKFQYYPPEISTIDPKTYNAIPSDDGSAVHDWGLGEQLMENLPDVQTFIARMMAKSEIDRMYLGKTSPLEQFIRVLSEKKRAAINDQTVQTALGTVLRIRSKFNLNFNAFDCIVLIIGLYSFHCRHGR